MPPQLTYPGIYIEELSSNAHTIAAAPTSIAVFVGYTHPFKTRQFNKPIQIFSFTDYQRYFGGFFRNEYFRCRGSLFGDVAQAVNQFFLNGGSRRAYVVGLLSQKATQAGVETLNLAWNELQNFNQLAAGEQAGAYSSPSNIYSYPGTTLTLGPLSFFPLSKVEPGIPITKCR